VRSRLVHEEGGYLMAALLVAMAVMAIMMSAALPAWRTMAQREKEAELIFRGEQYARALAMYQRRYANASPPNFDELVNQKFLRKKYKDPITGEDFQPVVAGQQLPGEGQPPGTANPGVPGQGGRQTPPGQGARQTAPGPGRQIAVGPGAAGRQGPPGFAQLGPGNVGRGGIVGVVSKSTEKSFRLYNGRDTYNQWVFMGTQQSTRAGGPPGAATPGGPGVTGPGGRGGFPPNAPNPFGRGAQPGRGPGTVPAPGAPQPGQRGGQRGGFGTRIFEN
jgi:type II secretory pathway pseudopilin PulG